MDHPLNSHPDCAYTPLEAALGRLESLADVGAAGCGRHAGVYEARDGYSR